MGADRPLTQAQGTVADIANKAGQDLGDLVQLKFPSHLKNAVNSGVEKVKEMTDLIKSATDNSQFVDSTTSPAQIVNKATPEQIEQITANIKQLDAETFKDRQEADIFLRKHIDEARPQLEAVLKDTQRPPTAEARIRIGHILASADNALVQNSQIPGMDAAGFAGIALGQVVGKMANDALNRAMQGNNAHGLMFREIAPGNKTALEQIQELQKDLLQEILEEVTEENKQK